MAVELGSRHIGGAIFEISRANPPFRLIKKLKYDFPRSYEPLRVVQKLREILFGVVREAGRVPRRIAVAFGPPLAECSVEMWIAPLGPGARGLTRKDLSRSFDGLFEQKQREREALIVYPTETFVNRYRLPFAPSPQRHRRLAWRPAGEYVGSQGSFGGMGLVGLALASPGTDCIIEVKPHDVRFRTFVATFSREVGVALGSIKEMLGGIPIEFVPLAAVYQQAMFGGMALRDVFLVDLGGRSTSLMLLRDGELRQYVSFAYGMENIALSVSSGEEESDRRVKSGLEGVKSRPLSSGRESDIMRDYIRGFLNEHQRLKVAEFVRTGVQNWRAEFMKALDHFYHEGPLPSQVLVAGGGARLPEVQNALKASDWIRDISFVDSAEVSLFDGKALFGGESLGGCIQGPEDAALASTIWYVIHEHAFV